jgi:hypothetical protein
MIVAAGFFVAGVGCSLALIIRELRKAPGGYEDEDGFYTARKSYQIGEEYGDKVERPSERDVHEKRIVLVERVAVKTGALHHHLVDDPRLAARPRILLKVVQRENGEAQQQDDLEWQHIGD